MAELGTTPMLRVTGLTRVFDLSPSWLNRLLKQRDHAVLTAVDGVDFTIGRGETFGLVGESGCGKSTVARLVVGLDAPSAGRVEFDGTDLAALRGRAAWRPVRRRIQMIFQDPYASLDPRWRVRDIIAEPLLSHGLSRGASATRARIDEVLGQVGLAARDGDRYPHEFSGGQRQRISIARALAARPDFLVCDEPTSALDVSVQAQILNLMKDLQRELGLTYLFISHNLAVVHHLASRIGVMYLGRLVEIAAAARLFAAPSHPYTRLLLQAIPDIRRPGSTREKVAGEVPNPLDPPSGCAFHPRCPFAGERCRRERPALRPGEGGFVACHAVEEGRLPAA